ncbi:hypothetical protein OAL21_02920 [Akkermansiaceae bacterium]|nr:hypothetical protein [Akkermansiaceae bacterium]
MNNYTLILMRFNWIRSIFKQNPLLYRIAHRFYLSSRFGGDGRLPQKGDDFYFDGFPRSGNSSLVKYLKESSLKKKLVFSSHLHCIATLKIARSLNIPVLVIFRDPLESISSWYFHVHDGENVSHIEQSTVNWMVREWTDYYSFVLDNQRTLKVVSLVSFRKRKEMYVSEINEEIGFTLFSWNHEAYNRFIEKKIAVKAINNLKLSGNSTQPSLQREKAKMMVKEVITPQQKRILYSIYEKLTD